MLERTSEMSLVYKQVTASITTDASDLAMGYNLEVDGMQFQRTIPVQDEDKHINVWELEVLLECVEDQGDLLRNNQVIWCCDNVTALTAVGK